MKTIAYIFGLLILGIFLCSPAFPIDKSNKIVKPDSTRKNIPILKDSTQSPANTDSDKTKKYDNFIDLNNNGIDDRAEKSKPSTKKIEPPKKETPPNN